MNQKRIKNLLARIKDGYPAERLEASRRRLRAVWSGELPDDSIPFVFRATLPPADPEFAPLAQLWYAARETHEQALLYQLSQIAERAVVPDDYIPGLFPGLRQLTVPSIFGATEHITETHQWVQPIIREPADVYRIPEPDYGPNTMAHFMLERARYFLEMTEGQIGVHIPDLQGPFSVASQLWGVQPFLMALYAYPDEARELLRRTTDGTLRYVQMLKDAVGEALAPVHCGAEVWMPWDAGICLSEDLMAVISADVIKEYLVPIVEEEVRRFGACYLHSCGDVAHCLEDLKAIPGLRGLNFCTAETDLADALRRTGRSLMYLVHPGPVASAHLRVLNTEEHAALCFEQFRAHRAPGLVFVDFLPGTTRPDDPDNLRMTERFRQMSMMDQHPAFNETGKGVERNHDYQECNHAEKNEPG